MILTFMRESPGLDEARFLKAFDYLGIDYVNFNDRNYSNFTASTTSLKVARKVLHKSLEEQLYRDVKGTVEKFKFTKAFIFNGRGISDRLLEYLSEQMDIIWYNPDHCRHKEHRKLEDVSRVIISTKPKNYNDEKYGEITSKKLVNVLPSVLSTNEERTSSLNMDDLTGLSERIYEVGFLGNWSRYKEAYLVEVSKLIEMPINVIGEGWESTEFIKSFGPLYGQPLKSFFSKTKVALAFTDANKDDIDPITVRYFQYSLLGSIGLLLVNDLNVDLLRGFPRDVLFETVPELAVKIVNIMKLNEEDYINLMFAAAEHTLKITPTAEEIIANHVI